MNYVALGELCRTAVRSGCLAGFLSSGWIPDDIAPFLGRSRAHFFQAVPRKVNGDEIFAGFMGLDSSKGRLSIGKRNGDPLDSIFGPSSHDFHHLAVLGELVGDLTDAVHARIDELHAEMSVLVGHDIHERTRVETGAVFRGHRRTRHRLFGRLFIVEADNDGFTGGDELTSDTSYVSVLAEVEAHFSLAQILGFVDKCEGIEAEHVRL